MLHKKLKPDRWGELSPELQGKVENYIDLLLAEQAELPLFQTQSKPGREVVEKRSVSYQLEFVKCGKPKCKCARGKGHGPYWYSYRRVGGKVVSKYIKKAVAKEMGL